MDEKVLRIEKFDDDFCGVAYVGKQRYVVEGALPDEQVAVEEKQRFGTVSLCRLRRVISPSSARVKPDCRLFGRCGGCDLRHMQYSAQCEAKTAWVRRKLSGIVTADKVADCVPASGLRNKVHLAFGQDKGKVTLGFFDAETHRVLDAPVCAAHGRWYPGLAGTLRHWAQHSGNTVYDPRTGKGCLRFAVVRRLTDCMTVTVVATSKPDDMEGLYAALLRCSPHVGLWYNHNAKRSNEVLSGDFEWIAGDKQLRSSLLGVSFAVGPAAFFQTNTAVATDIYRKVQQTLAQEGVPIVDLYSGIGVSSALFAAKGCTVDSIEVSPEACQNAVSVAQANGYQDKIHVHCGEVDKLLPPLSPQGRWRVFADPPRAGLGENVCRCLVTSGAEQIAYLSCNPLSLVKDLTILKEAYTVEWAIPFDMFRDTAKVEVLTLLTRRLSQ